MIHANPASSSASLNVSINYNNAIQVQQSSVGNGTAYSGVSAVTIIAVTDITIPIVFIATNATTTTTWNRINIAWLGNRGTRIAG